MLEIWHQMVEGHGEHTAHGHLAQTLVCYVFQSGITLFSTFKKRLLYYPGFSFAVAKNPPSFSHRVVSSVHYVSQARFLTHKPTFTLPAGFLETSSRLGTPVSINTTHHVAVIADPPAAGGPEAANRRDDGYGVVGAVAVHLVVGLGWERHLRCSRWHPGVLGWTWQVC